MQTNLYQRHEIPDAVSCNWFRVTKFTIGQLCSVNAERLRERGKLTREKARGENEWESERNDALFYIAFGPKGFPRLASNHPHGKLASFMFVHSERLHGRSGLREIRRRAVYRNAFPECHTNLSQTQAKLMRLRSSFPFFIFIFPLSLSHSLRVMKAFCSV